MRKPERTHNLKSKKRFRRQLRNNAAPAERKLWSMLRKRQVKGRRFRRQYSIGPYIVDFYCPEEQLVVEVDGAVHDDPVRRVYDNERAGYLQEEGLRIVRVSNDDVFNQPDVVVDAIAYYFRE